MKFSLTHELFLAMKMRFSQNESHHESKPQVHSSHIVVNPCRRCRFMFSTYLLCQLLESFNFFSLGFSHLLLLLSELCIYSTPVFVFDNGEKTHHFRGSLDISSLSWEYLHQNILKCHLRKMNVYQMYEYCEAGALSLAHQSAHSFLTEPTFEQSTAQHSNKQIGDAQMKRKALSLLCQQSTNHSSAHLFSLLRACSASEPSKSHSLPSSLCKRPLYASVCPALFQMWVRVDRLKPVQFRLP